MSTPRRAAIAAAAGAAGLLLAVAISAAAATNVTVSPRDNCGGFNGHVVFTGGSGSYIQLYGEVWENRCSGSTSVWLAWNSPGYHNVQTEAASQSATRGVNYRIGTEEEALNIKVTVCSTFAGWHCGQPTSVPAASTAPPTVTVTTPGPVVTVPVPVPVPEPAPRPRALRARLTMSWTWNGRHTELRGVRVGRLPAATRVEERCAGRECPRPRAARAAGARGVRRLLRSLAGHRYRAGDKLLITLTASGWIPERAEITIRSGRVPEARALR